MKMHYGYELEGAGKAKNQGTIISGHVASRITRLVRGLKMDKGRGKAPNCRISRIWLKDGFTMLKSETGAKFAYDATGGKLHNLPAATVTWKPQDVLPINGGFAE